MIMISLFLLFLDLSYKHFSDNKHTKNFNSDEWMLLDQKLDTGTFDGRTVINPFTNEIYIIGGYFKDAIDIEILINLRNC